MPRRVSGAWSSGAEEEDMVEVFWSVDEPSRGIGMMSRLGRWYLIRPVYFASIIRREVWGEAVVVDLPAVFRCVEEMELLLRLYA